MKWWSLFFVLWLACDLPSFSGLGLQSPCYSRIKPFCYKITGCFIFKVHNCIFLKCPESTYLKCPEAESISELPGLGGEENKEWLFNGYRLSFGVMRMFWNKIEVAMCHTVKVLESPVTPPSPEILKQLSGPLPWYLLYQVWTQVRHMELLLGNSENPASTALCILLFEKVTCILCIGFIFCS